MKHYLELTLLPDAEANLGFLWQKVFQQIHLMLVENKVAENQSAVALSYPQYGDKNFPLGAKLRLLAESESSITQLNIGNWLKRLTDYVHISSIKLVPEKVTYVSFVRQNVKGEARLQKDMISKAKRWSEKSGIDYSECLAQLKKTKPVAESKLPFIQLESHKTKQNNPTVSPKFKLFINMIEQGNEQQGNYNCYGLSQNNGNLTELATIPWF